MSKGAVVQLPIAPRTAFSHSQLSTWGQCRRKWYYHYLMGLEKRGPATSAPLVGGTVLHEGLRTWYRSGFDLEAAVAALRTSWEDEMQGGSFLGDFDFMTVGFLETILRNYHDRWVGAEPYKMVRVAEGKLEAEIGGVPLEGILDLLVEDDGGKLLVMDHKSTTGWLGDKLYNRVKHEKQLRLYALLAREALGIEASGGLCNAIYSGKYATAPKSKATKFDRWRFHFPTETLRETVQWVQGLVRDMREVFARGGEVGEEDFPQSPSGACGWCEYEELCSSPPPLRAGRIAASFTSATTSEN